METQLPHVLTLQRAAQELSISRSTLYRMLRANELTSVRVHKREMIPSSEIRRLATPRTRRAQGAKERAAASPAAGFDAARFRVLRRR
jgi:excisionase family DNA binding protein